MSVEWAEILTRPEGFIGYSPEQTLDSTARATNLVQNGSQLLKSDVEHGFAGSTLRVLTYAASMLRLRGF